MLLELHVPFDVLDRYADFGKYKVLILPDEIDVDAETEGKLKAFVAGGGKVIASWHSAQRSDGAFALDSRPHQQRALSHAELLAGWAVHRVCAERR